MLYPKQTSKRDENKFCLYVCTKNLGQTQKMNGRRDGLGGVGDGSVGQASLTTQVWIPVVHAKTDAVTSGCDLSISWSR